MGGCTATSNDAGAGLLLRSCPPRRRVAHPVSPHIPPPRSLSLRRVQRMKKRFEDRGGNFALEEVRTQRAGASLFVLAGCGCSSMRASLSPTERSTLGLSDGKLTKPRRPYEYFWLPPMSVPLPSSSC